MARLAGVQGIGYWVQSKLTQHSKLITETTGFSWLFETNIVEVEGSLSIVAGDK